MGAFGSNKKRLDVHEPRPSPNEPSAPDGMADDPSPPWQSRVVLIVEADADAAETLERALAARGFNALRAPDFNVAKALVSALRPALVVLDMVPVSNLEPDFHLRTTDTKAVLPVLVLCSQAPGTHGRRALNRAGAGGVLVAPFIQQQLFVMVDALICRSDAQTLSRSEAVEDPLRWIYNQLDARLRPVLDDRVSRMRNVAASDVGSVVNETLSTLWMKLPQLVDFDDNESVRLALSAEQMESWVTHTAENTARSRLRASVVRHGRDLPVAQADLEGSGCQVNLNWEDIQEAEFILAEAFKALSPRDSALSAAS